MTENKTPTLKIRRCDRFIKLTCSNRPNYSGLDPSSLFPLSTETAAVHCEAARPIADAYRRFHLLPTKPMATPFVYSASFGSAYEVTKEAASEAITGLALSTMDFNKLVETAYNDGARIF